MVKYSIFERNVRGNSNFQVILELDWRSALAQMRNMGKKSVFPATERWEGGGGDQE
jgi:hypothetical protein